MLPELVFIVGWSHLINYKCDNYEHRQKLQIQNFG